MQINSFSPVAGGALDRGMVGSAPAAPQQGDNSLLRSTFDQFVGESLFGQMMSSMRKTVGKPAYFHGGRAEEVFQKQLDQQLARQMTAASGDKLAGPMFDLFQLQRS